jgi:hypothetical protein
MLHVQAKKLITKIIKYAWFHYASFSTVKLLSFKFNIFLINMITHCFIIKMKLVIK